MLRDNREENFALLRLTEAATFPLPSSEQEFISGHASRPRLSGQEPSGISKARKRRVNGKRQTRSVRGTTSLAALGEKPTARESFRRRLPSEEGAGSAPRRWSRPRGCSPPPRSAATDAHPAPGRGGAPSGERCGRSGGPRRGTAATGRREARGGTRYVRLLGSLVCWFRGMISMRCCPYR